MKKILSLTLCLTLCLALCACTIGKTPAPTAEPTVEPTAEPTVEPTVEPTAETTGEGELSAILTDIYERYYPGTAGCSLNAAKNAGRLLDWYAASGKSETAQQESAAFAAAHDMAPEAVTADGVPIDFPTKLRDIFTSAMQLSFEKNLGILEHAGYERSAETWDAQSTNELFDALYAGCGIEAPKTITVFYSDDMAERFLSARFPTDEVNEYAVFGALKTAGVIPQETELLSFTQNGKTLTLDLDAAFATAVQTMGTSGEYMILGSVVNSFLAAFDSESITLTVNGAPLETGHNIYDYALTTYADNVGQV